VYTRLFLRRHRLGIVAGAVAIALAGVWRTWPAAGARAGLEGQIDAIVTQAMAEGPIAGMSVAVARGGRVVHAKGYGVADVENQLPASADTIYQVGSITKQFTAAAVMQLVEQGKVRLNAPITAYVRDYPTRGHNVTVESLLNHTSGVRNFTTLRSWWRTMTVEMTPEEIVGVFRDEPFDFSPGTAFSYSNSGYILLGLLIERVSGKPFGGYLNENLFAPLDLGSTSYCDHRALVRDRARGYKVVDGAFVNADSVSPSQAYAAGAVCSNALDLVTWSRALSNGRAVSAKSYARMIAPGALTDGSRLEYGYGLAVGYLEQHHRIGHVGGTLGFAGQIANYDEDGLTIVVLSNTEGARVAGVESDIARLMLGLGDREVKDILLAPEELESYAGTYDLQLGAVTIAPAKGRLELVVSVPGIEGRLVLLNQGQNVFRAESDAEVSLSFDLEKGVAEAFVLSHKGITMRGTRVHRGS
jgi:CubicO group peptidase (beta-lactamase class C family)